MPCMCVQHAVRPFQTGSAGPRRSQSHNSSGVTCSCPPAHHQTPRPPALPTTAQAWAAVECRSRSSAQRPTRHPVCRAQKQEQEEDERDMVGGFDVDAPAGFLESEAVGIVFKVGFVLFVSAGIAAILLLAKPVIDNTIQAFPYRTSGGKEQPGAPDRSLIPGLDSGPPQDDGGSLFD